MDIFCEVMRIASRSALVFAGFFGVMAVLDWSIARHFWDRPSESPEDHYERSKVWRCNSDRWLLNLAVAWFLGAGWLVLRLARWLLGC